MLGAHATLGSSLKGSRLGAVKLHKRQVLIVGVLLLAVVGGWWAVQSGALGGWLSPATSVTAASGQIVIQQGTPAILTASQTQNQSGQTVAAPVNVASATETAATETAATETATAAAVEPVSVAGVAGVNGASVWDDAGNLLVTLDSGALVTVQASAGDGAWLSVQTAVGEGWTPASSIIAYGLGRLTSVVLPDGVLAAANTSIAATSDAETTAAAAPTAADTDAQSVAALIAQVTGVGTHLNIRSGPGTEYGVIAEAADGATYMAVGRNAAGDWLLLQIGDDAGSTGWASASYVALSGDLQVLPATAPL